jgi:microtubule-associated protein, RP/EB family
MINEVTINSNNAIEMSRGELLGWLNDLLKTSLGKIEQLGSGAAYCQLMDVLYPGKIPLGKVNWRAKFDYEFVANFKILQQSFTKLGIMKHIEVEKLVKCKYQDNLELLQWFKKIFDSNGVTARDYNAVQRRGDAEPTRREKEK